MNARNEEMIWAFKKDLLFGGVSKSFGGLDFLRKAPGRNGSVQILS
jgi:hypothetical protein